MADVRKLAERRARRPALAAAVTLATLAAPGGVGAQALDPRDEAALSQAINQALETERSGRSIPWSNPATGSAGEIVLSPATYPSPERPCRDYVRSVRRADGAIAEGGGSGCRVGRGVWALEERTSAAAALPAPSSPSTTAPAAAPSEPAVQPPAPEAASAGAPPRQPRRVDRPAPAKATATAQPAKPPPAKPPAPALPSYTLPSKSAS